MIRGLNSGRARDFSFLQNSLPLNAYRGSSPAVQRPRREADLSPSSGAGAKNGLSCASAPAVHVNDLGSNSCTLYTFINVIILINIVKRFMVTN